MLNFVYVHYDEQPHCTPYWPNGIPLNDKEEGHLIDFNAERSVWFFWLEHSLCNIIKKYSFRQLENGELPSTERYIFPIDAPVTKRFWNAYTNKPLLIPERVINDVKEGRAKIMFIRNYEADGFILDKRVEMMKFQAEYYNISLKSLIYLDCNYLVDKYLLKEGIQGIYYNTFQYSTLRSQALSPIIDIVKADIQNKKARDKKFLCFNRNVKWHRAYIVNRILEEGLDKDGIVTCSKHLYYGGDIDFNDKEYVDFQALKNRVPMYYDVEHDYNNLAPSFKMNAEAQLKCYFNVTTETHYDSQNDSTRAFYTEKTFKPVIAYQPFIVISTQYHLRHMKEMGYETFSDFIDESYDNITDNKERLDKAFNTIKQVCSMSYQQLSNMLYDMLPILEHNYQLNNKDSLEKGTGVIIEREVLDNW